MENTIVIGAGVTGAYTAYFLARSGNNVTLIDPFEDDKPASHINPGGLNPLHGPGIPGDMEDFYMHAFRLHLEHWQAIQQKSGMYFHGRRIKRYFLAFTDEDKQSLLELQALYQKHEDFTADWLDTDQLVTQAPLISKEVLGGLYTQGNATVSPKAYNKAIIAAARAFGANIMQASVTAINATSNQLILDNHQTLEYKKLVLCCGAEKTLALQLGLSIPVFPLKGDLLIARLPKHKLSYDITWQAHGIYQFDNGCYWLGGTRIDNGFDRTTTPESKNSIMATIHKMLPSLELDVIDHKTALRPATPDGKPLIGQRDNIYFATGGGSKGMLLSAGMADCVTRLIQGRHSPYPESLGIERFQPGESYG